MIAGLLGGLGLFLLGMRLMTDGLRSAAGPALRSLLGNWTKTPLRGLASGFVITALVQSSSAVTVAVIGFVNAGLMTMQHSVGVILGSNIGTTVTGWIVAAVGVSVNVKAMALPLIGLGVIMRLTGGKSRRGFFGDALTGFGIFFLGIEVLQDTFKSLETVVDLGAFAFGGPLEILVFVTIGAGLTLLMQSSSAAMALVLTASMTGVISLNSAAAAVIGTNIGTTSTALFSVIGATKNAKKVATAHIIFNLVTGCVAIFIIPIYLNAMAAFSRDELNIAASLAVFHTTFNILGVLLFIPFTSQLAQTLDRLFASETQESGRPRYLDDNVLKTPPLAMDALFMELGRLGEMTRLMGQKSLSSKFRYQDFVKDKASVDSLAEAVREYCVKLQRENLTGPVALGLPKALRIVQYYRKAVNIMDEVSQEHALLDHKLPDESSRLAKRFRRDVRDLLNTAHTPCAPEFADLEKMLHGLLDVYHQLKEALLQLGADDRIELDKLVAMLDYYSRIRVMSEQAVKGTNYWASMRDLERTCGAATEENEYAWKPEG